MKNIVKSLFTVLIVSVLALGVSQAFFSDTETSTGNTFTTGAIDLTVDAHGWYNGLECVDGFWTNSCQPTDPNLILNGSFEVPEVTDPSKWEIFANGTSGMEWTVEWESTVTSYGDRTRPTPAFQEYHEGVLGAAQNGDQYAELDSDWFGPSDPLNGEPALVRIYQNVTTEPGKKYELRYYYSPRPNVVAENNKLLVRIDGSDVDYQELAGGATINWQPYTYVFTATGTSTKVEFAGAGTADSLGVFLDNVSLRVMTCLSEFTEYEGRACGSTWELTNLGVNNKFFDFDDIKPGDIGENTISLHVTNNPAYACVRFGNIQDDDLGLTEPEGLVDTTDGIGYGEVSEHTTFFMWHDDGDNIWEENETPITQAPLFVADGWNDEAYPLFTPQTEAMQPGQTEYVGLAWCAGALNVDMGNYSMTCDGHGMGNESQTDKLTVDVSFYVEQSRHNEEFTCTYPVPNDLEAR